MTNNRFWFTLFLVMFILMSFSTLRFHFGFEIRLNQLFILFVFLLIFLYDLKNKTLNLKFLLFSIAFGILLSLISLSSSFEKIGEFKFIIKYAIVFPAILYTGSRIIELIEPKELVKAIEIAVFVYCIDAIILYFFPIPFLIHDRGALTGFQGTFWETVWLAKAIMLLLIASISLRVDFQIYPKKKFLLFIFYLFVIINLLITKSKAIWVGLFSIIAILTITRTYFFLKSYKKLYGNYFLLFENLPKYIKRVNIKYLFGFVLIISLTIYIFNNFIFEKPIVSKEMIVEKLESERGKAFVAAVEFLEKSNWIGAYGFGAVEKYFSTFYRDDVIGLGEGVSMLFNSYLDIWISVGFAGVLYLLFLLTISFSTKYLFTISIPTFLFVISNIAPYTGSEYYWLFLGISYGIKKYKA